ncbi:MAG: NYN domain-containing protein [Coleofasciculus sp. S288]|nr:NYN domain-containing protein [Coleofasciculus sp. S288]
MLNNFDRDAIFSPEEISDTRGRLAIFIDGVSLFYAANQLGIEVDYLKLLCQLTDSARLLRAFFYIGVESMNERQQRFLLWMRRHGYRVVTKEVAQLADGSKRANLDVEIAVDLMVLADFYDTAVVVSGNANLAYALNIISYRGVRVELVSLRSMTDDALLNACDRYIDLESIREDIQKTPATRNKSNAKEDLRVILSHPNGHNASDTIV